MEAPCLVSGRLRVATAGSHELWIRPLESGAWRIMPTL